MEIPRLIIAGTQSGVGKTTVTTGLMGALAKRGYRVQGFKAGPDFIDPSYHYLATNLPSRNLDSWLLNERRIKELFIRASSKAQISIIEGVMGLYDGMSGIDERGSTSHLSKLLRCPVILVVDASSLARSVGALVLGYKLMDRRVKLKGAILNNVAGEKHAHWCKQAIERYAKVKVLGSLMRNKEIELEERHLGLIPTKEKREILLKKIEKIIEFVGYSLDIDQIIKIAYSAEPLPDTWLSYSKEREETLRIGVAYDEAFNFYYRDALDDIQNFGGKIEFFSPIKDEFPKNISGLYIGGGFPEVLAKELENNNSMRKSIKRYVEKGLPTIAECGGLMYLTNSIRDFNSKSFKMIGLIDAETIMSKRLTLNYTLAEVIRDNILSLINSKVKGHEFHYSSIEGIREDSKFAYSMIKGRGLLDGKDGFLIYNLIASYMHIHLSSNRKRIVRFLKACKEYSRR